VWAGCEILIAENQVIVLEKDKTMAWFLFGV
jgi:hypothetical protein